MHFLQPYSAKLAGNSSNQFYIITSKKGEIRFHNFHFQKSIKNSFVNNQANFFHDYISENEREKYFHTKNIFLQNPEISKSIELHFVDAKNTSLKICWEMTALINENGEPENICFTGTSITFKKVPEKEVAYDFPKLNSLALSKSSALALGRSLEFFRSLTGNFPVIVYEYIFKKNGSHGFKYISPAIKKVFGISADEYLSYINSNTDEAETISKKNIESIDTNEPFNFEGHFSIPGKGVMWFSANSCFSYLTGNGNKIFAGIIIDITERKKAEEALVASEARFRNIAKSVPGVLYQWCENNDGTSGFSYMSPKLKEYFNIEPSQLFSLEQMVHPADKKKWDRSVKEGLKNIKPWEFEGRFLSPDGSIKWWRGTSALPVKTEKGNIYNGILTDITQIITAKEELVKSNERYDYVAKATSDAIWDWDYKTQKIYRGQGFAKIFGYNKSFIWADEKGERVHPDDRKKMLESLENAIQKKADRWEAEYRVLCKNNIYKTVINKAYLVKDDNNNIVRIIGSLRDVSAQRMLEKKLIDDEIQKKREIIKAIIQAQEREREEIAYELHDNINQVLATCMLQLDLAAKNPGLASDYIPKCTNNLQQAINEIRDISRNLTTYTLDNLGLVAAIKDITGKINETDKIFLKFNPSKTHDEKVIPNEIKLSVLRIVQEDINNVIKHAKATELKINLSFNSKKLRLKLTDNGKGFESKKIKKGLGLQNIQSRVEYYHGKMKLNSSPGNGCSLYIEFPY